MYFDLIQVTTLGGIWRHPISKVVQSALYVSPIFVIEDWIDVFGVFRTQSFFVPRVFVPVQTHPQILISKHS